MNVVIGVLVVLCELHVTRVVVVDAVVMRDATRKFAIATTRRKSFATNFGSTLYPPLS